MLIQLQALFSHDFSHINTNFLFFCSYKLKWYIIHDSTDTNVVHPWLWVLTDSHLSIIIHPMLPTFIFKLLYVHCTIDCNNTVYHYSNSSLYQE